MKGFVTSCTRRRDDKWLLMVEKNRVTYPVISDYPVAVGADVRIPDRAVAS